MEMDFLNFEEEKQDCIVIIGEAKGYLLNSIQDKLIEDMFDVVLANDIAAIEAVSSTGMEIGAFLVYASESVLADKQLLVYIKDKATEVDIPVFTVGNKEDMDDVKNTIPDHIIRMEFARPVNVKDMAADIRRYLEEHDRKKKKKILAVDDSGMVLNSIKNWLGDKYQVMMANSGVEAIKYMTLNRPDLILLDYEMPICDGKMTLSMIRAEKEFADIPVIFLTGKQDKQSIMGVMSLKPEGYLLKTMKPADIKKNIDEFFEKRKVQS